MSLSKDELVKTKAKLTALRRAERRLQNRLADIDWEYDELRPEIAALLEGAAQGELPVITVENEG